MWVQSLGQEDLLEEEMTAHSSVSAWEIPRVTMLDMTELLNSNKLVNTYIFVWYL